MRSLAGNLICVFLALSAGCRSSSQDSASDKSSPGKISSRELSKADFDRAEYLRRRGAGHMENFEWADAERHLSELAELLPGSRTALRNLAILRVLAITAPGSPFRASGSQQERQQFSDAVDRARSAIEKYRSRVAADEDQSLADLLLGKLLVHADRPESPSFKDGLQSLMKAADSQPDRPDFRMAVAVAMQGNREYADSPQVLRELGRTFDLAPNNIHVMRLLLETQALSLRSSNTETQQLAQTGIQVLLPRVAELVGPLNESVLQHTRVDLLQVLTDTLEAHSNDSALFRTAMIISNTLKPETPVQIDMRRIDRHLLEYVLPRFDENLLESAKATGHITAQSATVLRGFAPVTVPVTVRGVSDVVIADFTLDGVSDLIVVRDGRLEVHTRSSTRTLDWSVSTITGNADRLWSHVLLADIDRDTEPGVANPDAPFLLEDRDGDRRIVSDPSGEERWFDTDLDVVLWNDSGLEVLRNTPGDDGQRSLQSVAIHSIPDISDVVAADIEADGDLDFVVATSSGIFLLSNANGTVFHEQKVSEIALNDLAIGDVDRNIAMDVVGISDRGPGLLQNLFHARFRWLPGEDIFGDTTRGQKITVADVDGNLSWDVVTGGSSGITICLTQTTAPGVISTLKSVHMTAESVRDFSVADLDNDGYRDICALTSAGTDVWRGAPDGQFSKLEQIKIPVSGSKITTTDFDDDGDLDLIVVDDDAALQFLENEGGSDNHWMRVVVRGKSDDPQFRSRRANMHGFGTVLEIMAGTLWQAHIVDQPVVHVGLGMADRLDAVRVIWTDGIPQDVVTDDLLRPRIGILAPQILKGSCPYIYTWVGDGFRFFTDCLWASPIGLIQASGDFAPTREWEHLLIPGDRLKARNDEYVLQVTEELWEIAYFDQIRLIAVDHPADVQIFTNEKVGPPSLAEHRVHTVHRPRLPQRVVDARGNDLLPALAQHDGNYVQPFEGRLLQGLTDEWTMEFDVGPLEESADVRLFLTGWIFPTDTSLNVHIYQNPNLNPPVPPSIEIPDSGGWKTVRPFIGFPGGKTKAMVVDLTGIVGPENTRFRLRSSMELYWDQAFFTAGERDAPTRSQHCCLVTADLHRRGFSRRIYAADSIFRHGSGPESYDYTSVTTEPRWPPLFGRFTRYGAVGELLQRPDDRLVVMGPGDEVTVRFAVPETPVPDGWTRDFILRNVGWDKDGDLNTVYGQSSEPFPFQAMTAYPFHEVDRAPDSPEYRQYIGQYQTREYSSRAFWRAVRSRGDAW